jgi:hypothetical protein
MNDAIYASDAVALAMSEWKERAEYFSPVVHAW